MSEKYINKYILVLFIVLIGFIAYLQYSVIQNTNKLREDEIKQTKIYAQNIVEYIKRKVPSKLYKSLDEDKGLRYELNNILNTFITDNYKYIFLLRNYKNKYYRFLLDGSNINPEEYNSLFFPKSKLYDEVYKTQKIKILKQKDEVENVWLSILAPVVYNGKTEALLVIDLSKDYGNYISKFNSPISHLIGLIQIFLSISFVILVAVFYKYYRFRKNIILDKTTQAYTKLYLEEFCLHREKQDEFMLMVDIDGFKNINIKYGYQAGNELLKRFVFSIQHEVLATQSKSVFRISGGEFIIIIAKNNKYTLEEITQQLFEQLSKKTYILSDNTVKLSISVSSIEIGEKCSLNTILRVLDEKLLEIKSKGKNSYGIISQRDRDNIKYSDIDFIKELLNNQQLICLYQPIFDTKTKQIVKYEALVRLDDNGKYISPYYFLDIVRGTTQYIKMSKLVFKHIFETLKKYPDIHISANVHLDDLFNSEMMSMIIEELFYHQEYANRLTFEILEDKEIYDYERVNEIFTHLRAYGSKIAIDDFGSGYANYLYLLKLNVDIIKLDSSLIKELKTQPIKSKQVISSIVDLAHKLDCEVIAEFVSDEEIYNAILKLGIEYSQGYYLGEPRLIGKYIGSKKDTQ